LTANVAALAAEVIGKSSVKHTYQLYVRLAFLVCHASSTLLPGANSQNSVLLQLSTAAAVIIGTM
jgi:hypothetical protein